MYYSAVSTERQEHKAGIHTISHNTAVSGASLGSPDFVLHLLEGGSVERVVLPAQVHESEQTSRALGGQGQSLTKLYLRDDLIVLDAHEWFDTSHEDLPTAYTEHPHVTQSSEAAKVDALRGHPFDGQLSMGGCECVFEVS